MDVDEKEAGKTIIRTDETDIVTSYVREHGIGGRGIGRGGGPEEELGIYVDVALGVLKLNEGLTYATLYCGKGQSDTMMHVIGAQMLSSWYDGIFLLPRLRLSILSLWLHTGFSCPSLMGFNSFVFFGAFFINKSLVELVGDSTKV